MERKGTKMNLDLDSGLRKEIFHYVLDRIEQFYEKKSNMHLTPNGAIEDMRAFIEGHELRFGMDYQSALASVINGLEEYTVNTAHPNYFGLFNPRPNFAGIIADLITASYNPQLAVWSHAPYAVEVESKLIQDFAVQFGLDADSSDGVFAAGGAEANLTAVLCALNDRYPFFHKTGFSTFDRKPVILCSAEAHHSMQKAAKVVGLGSDSIKVIPADRDLRLDLQGLKRTIQALKEDGASPLMIAGTAGTTGTGAIDPLVEIHDICRDEKIWFHVDGAYGGAAMLSKNLRPYLAGIESADSITFDAHKWMSVPMGASIFLTGKKDILRKTFQINAEYMPKEVSDVHPIDPFSHSIQWSRRFIGLKVYISLLFYGWKGYEEMIDRQVELGELLRTQLVRNRWELKNSTPLPVVCFTDTRYEGRRDFCQALVDRLVKTGKAWVSTYPVLGIPTIRACVTNYASGEAEINDFINEVNKARAWYEEYARNE